MSVTLYEDQGSLVLKFPPDPGLIAAIKSLPSYERRWEPLKRAWIIDPGAGKKVADIIKIHTGQTISVPNVRPQQPTIKLIQIIYIGRCKDRNGDKSAFGMTSSYKWDVIFPEQVLRKWFEADDELPSNESNLFSILGVTRDATTEEIKTGYRRMAKQWHPDLNQGDPDAQEQFLRIQDAWEILSNESSKARYIAGLVMESTLQNQQTQYGWVADLSQKYEYRSPLRCGHIMCEGVNKTGRFVVSKILEWQDIFNDQGLMLVSSWVSGDDRPTLNYV